jgi:hypothetical protein
MSVAPLRVDPAGGTKFTPRTPFFQRPILTGEPPGSAPAGSVAGKAGDARGMTLGPPPHAQRAEAAL